MIPYPKIQGIFKRDEKKKFIVGAYSVPEIEYLKDNTWVFTEKVDGTNIRIIWDGDNITYKGRGDASKIPVRLYKALDDIFQDKKQLFKDKFGDKFVCLYGEGYGDGIQAIGSSYRKDNSFVLFDIKIDKWWFKRDDLENTALALGLDIVPIVAKGTLQDGIELVKRGFYSSWGNFLAEGIVAKTEYDLLDRSGARIMTKIKYVDFL